MRRGVSMRTMPHGPTHGPLSQRECGQSSWWKAFGRCGERLICPQIAPEALRYPLEKLARPGAKKAQQSTISRYKKPKEERQASDNSKALKTSPLIGVESKSETLSPWAHVAPAVPRVLVLSAFAALRVRGGALEIDHGPQKDRRSLRFDVDASKPAALLFDSHGEHMSGEALRWCTRHGIALILPNGPDGFLSLMATCADTPDASPADPGLMLTQCRAALDPATAFCIAREIVQAK